MVILHKTISKHSADSEQTMLDLLFGFQRFLAPVANLTFAATTCITFGIRWVLVVIQQMHSPHLTAILVYHNDSMDIQMLIMSAAQSPLDCYPITRQRFPGHTNVANCLIGMGYV